MAQTMPGLQVEEVQEENYTRVLWSLAWPVVALNALQTLNSLLDRFFIGHLPSSAPLTAHAGALSLMFLFFSLAMAVGTSATALVSRAYGAGEIAEYRMAGRQSLGFSIVMSLVMMLIALIVAPTFAEILVPAQDVEAKRLMTDFVRIFALGLPAMYVIQSLAGSLRGVGDTRSPMMISGFQIILHMVLNMFLVLPTVTLLGVRIPSAGLGLQGAAIALSSSATVAAVIYMVLASKTPLGEVWRVRLPAKEWVARILRIATPAGAMAVLRVTSLGVFMFALKYVPNASTVFAGASTSFAIEPIMFMPAFGLSAAAAALVGQSLGMKKPDRAERLGWLAAHNGALITLVLSLPIFIFANSIAMGLVGGKADIASEAALLLRYLCITEVFFAYGMVLTGAMQGAGDTLRPFWITLVSMWVLRTPMVFIVALTAGTQIAPWLIVPVGFGLGSAGAWLSLAFSQAIQGILTMAAFKGGAWKTRTV